jgi:hypothetical protein
MKNDNANLRDKIKDRDVVYKTKIFYRFQAVTDKHHYKR